MGRQSVGVRSAGVGGMGGRGRQGRGGGAGRQADPASPRRPRSGVQGLPGLEGARSRAGEPHTQEQPALARPAKGCSAARPGHPAGALGLLCVPDFVPTVPESMHERLQQRAPEQPALPLLGGSEHSDQPAPPRTCLCRDHTARLSAC